MTPPPSAEDGAQQADTTVTGKVDVDPIENEGLDIKGARDLIKDAQKLFKKASAKGGVARGSLGTYFPRFRSVKTKFRGDIGTTLHELAHSRDDELNLGKVTNLRRQENFAQLSAELYELGKGGSGGPKESEQYNMAEGAAEYLRAWMVNPDYTAKVFPATHEYMQARIPEDFLIGMRQLGDDIRKFAGAPAMKQVEQQVAFEPEQQAILDKIRSFISGNPLGDEFTVTGMDVVKTKWLNDRHLLTKAKHLIEERSGKKFIPTEDFELQAALLAGRADKAGEAIRSGIPDPKDFTSTTTKGIDEEILQHLDTSSEEALVNDLKLMNYKMVVERTTEKGDIRDSGMSDTLSKIGPISGISGFSNLAQKGMTERQVVARFNEEWAQLPLAQRKRIEAAAEGYRRISDGLLRYAVDKGLLSEAGYERIKSQNAYYVSMQRVLRREWFRCNQHW